jgi:hypothetical protein
VRKKDINLAGPRPDGIPGLLIDQIKLTGIFRTAKGFVAQVLGDPRSKRSYLIKEGDQLYDGDVVSINRNQVVFKQIVQDPTALKPFREVVKSLDCCLVAGLFGAASNARHAPDRE